MVQAAEGADLLVFVLPHQFVVRALTPLKGKLKSGAIGISLIKGFEIVPSGGIKLLSDTIRGILGCPVSVLMGKVAVLGNMIYYSRYILSPHFLKLH